MMTPTYSPWGEIQHCRVLCPYVYDVDTASHGGIMVEAREANSIFSEAALQCSFQELGYYCFEEDCAAPVALRELMDKKLFTAPVNDYWKPGEYEACINDSVRRYYPDYWKAREAVMAEKQEPGKTQNRKEKECER